MLRRRLCIVFCSLGTVSAKTRVAILGLPNVGKSSLFNAIAQQSIAQAANFPFCTIEPNVAPIAVPSEYLANLGAHAGSARCVPATIEWVDVAGLAKGASRGEGLGNKFLGTARECDVICHLVRAFDDPDTIHVDGRLDPTADAEVINLELILADEAHCQRRLERTTCRGEERAALEKVVAGLQQGIPARAVGLAPAQTRLAGVKSMGLLTLKPMLYTFNLDEADFALGREAALAEAESVVRSLSYCDAAIDRVAVCSAKLEAGLAARDHDEQLRYLDDIGIELTASGGRPDALLCHHALPTVVRELLGLELAYTGPGVPSDRSQTTKAHLFRRQSLTAGGLAGRLHGDIEKGFLRAEVCAAHALLEHETFAAARDAGSIRTEGREYALQAEDVVLIKWK